MSDYRDLQARVDRLIACTHQPEIRLRRDSAGRPRYMRQCVRCGERIGNAVARAEVPAGTIRAFDEQAVTRRIAQRTAAWRRVHEANRASEHAAWRAEHERYLRTPQWARLRAAVLRRAHHVCEGCGIAKATQVHHLHYRRWQREMLFDLVAVCDPCHARIHDRDLEAAS